MRLRFAHGTMIALASAALIAPSKAVFADVVIDWDNVLLQTIRETGGPPCPISRTCAMTMVAVYDAVNSIAGGYEPYMADLPAPAPGASAEAAGPR